MLLTFDLDGTLIRGPFGVGVFPAVAAEFKAALSRQGTPIPDHFDRQLKERFLQEHRRREASPNRYTAYDWDDIALTVSRQLGIDVAVDIVQILHTVCAPTTCHLKPGAQELLAYLQHQGQTMTVLTNGFHKYQHIILRYLGIHHYFDDIIAPDRLHQAKPDREIFDAVRQHAPAHQVCHIGDSLAMDILGAKQAGCMAIWIAPHLPDDLRQYAPQDRARSPHYLPHLQRTSAELFHTSAQSLDQFRPEYVITDLRDIIPLYSDLH
ncbi:HAD-IA family hydrolase [candidate division KSB3 bacterium]|uniref:HAD-IA family hydrolase n=1 Tax=candidate division KSB3 bacterium TaxID=2044937 RepID=A0A9D5Q7S6_9BACT|nr:HAD-IA family hydrolase [candidate division KSB3 bacterium]MBD3327179.1 HAD-IA family hydrolase [candidate division KSB3 bacterium]